MPSTKLRPSSIPKSIEAFAERKLPKSEETDCQKRGYTLSNVTLGRGAYAKVKLGFVTAMKLRSDKYLRDQLRKQGNVKVAIKIISKKNAPAEYLNKFMPREIQALSCINGCANVVKLFETFSSDSRIYLVLEYADKGDLLEFINSRKSHIPGIGEDKARQFFKQLVQGLEYCHKQNIVHRDMKCENILIQGDDVIKISDFGFATRIPTSQDTLLETFCGSYAYAAPEILQAKKYDGKIADVWSLGIILFAMLNGKLPFDDGSLSSIIKQTRGKLRFSNKVQLSSECRDLVKKILTASQRQRITIPEILKHSWLRGEKVDEELVSSLTRGIPDGKSDKSVTKMSEESKTNSQSLSLKKASETRDTIGSKVEIYTPGVVVKKWLAKNNTASATEKLLRNKREDDIGLQTSKLPKTPVSCRGSCISNVMTYSASKRYPVIASAWIPVRMSGRTEETRREIEALHKQVKMEACGYQIEAQKGVAKSSKNEKASDQKHEMNPSEITIKSNKGSAKNLKTNGRADICYQGVIIDDTRNPGVSLPPVENEYSRGKMSTKQSNFKREPKQKDRKAVQKQTSKEAYCDGKNSRFLKIGLNFRDHWLAKFSKTVNCSEKNDLLYYTLVGKEVGTRMKEKQDNCNFDSLDLFQTKKPL